MIDRRINIPKAHVTLIEGLIDDKENDLNGPFKTKASVLAFAAALGAAEGDPLPFTESAGDPIRKSVFVSAGYDSLINILAVSSTNDPKVLSNSDEMEEQRAQIFEGYANRGLNVLQNKLTGESDYLNGIRLTLLQNRTPSDSAPTDLEITSLL